MPGRDGTGPEGTGPRGRRMGPCRGRYPRGADEVKKIGATEEQAAETGTQGDSKATPSQAYGVGRGGKPRGCGMGHCGGRQRSR
jgi:hypothetical protein